MTPLRLPLQHVLRQAARPSGPRCGALPRKRSRQPTRFTSAGILQRRTLAMAMAMAMAMAAG
jgi:hypothetical protein